MKRAVILVAAAFALVVGLAACSGCAADKPNNAQTAVFQIEQQYKHALQIAVAYDSLTLCTAPVHDVICSDPVVVKKIKNAKDVAGPAIQAAQATVRNPQFDASTANKITLSAAAALSVLTVITEPLEALLAKAATENGKK